MPAPLSKHLFSTTPYARLDREIDIHYDMELMAENTRDLVDCHRQLLRVQSEAAISNIRALKEIHSQQEETNALLDSVHYGIGRLQETSQQVADQLMYQGDVLERGFQSIAEGLIRNQRTLVQIADTLSRPYETKIQELLRNAGEALRAGMGDSGKDREADFADALRLLEKVLDDAIGKRNYVAWFQTGWLKWRCLGKVEEAEEAFAQAVRLSKSHQDAYYLDSLRHLAYMQYLSGRMEDAYGTIQKATAYAPNDHDALYDAARYATRVAVAEEDGGSIVIDEDPVTRAVELLDQCIDLRPQTIVTMFSEEDFRELQRGPLFGKGYVLLELLRRRTEGARGRASVAVAEWEKAVGVAEAALQEVHTDSFPTGPVPSEMREGIAELKRGIGVADYLAAFSIAEVAASKCHQVMEYAADQMKEAVKSGERRAAELRTELSTLSITQEVETRKARDEATSRQATIENEGFTGWLGTLSCIGALLVAVMFVVLLVCLPLQFLARLLVSFLSSFLMLCLFMAAVNANDAVEKKRRIARVNRECAEEIDRINVASLGQASALKNHLNRAEHCTSLAKEYLARTTP